MNNSEAIALRQSRRSYLDTPINPASRKSLQSLIQRFNQEANLSIHWIDDGQDTFRGFNPTYGLLKGVKSYLAFVGKTSDPNLKEKCGYYGELLVLEATKLGLGTCWVGGTYNRNHCPFTVQKDETLICLITIGNVPDKKGWKEGTIYKLTHRKSKAVEDMYSADTPVPDWFAAGMKAVQKAPSAVNLQPVHFNYKNGIVTAEVKNTAPLQLIDLGIAKAHFELIAGGKFEFGNNGVFTKNS